MVCCGWSLLRDDFLHSLFSPSIYIGLAKAKDAAVDMEAGHLVAANPFLDRSLGDLKLLRHVSFR